MSGETAASSARASLTHLTAAVTPDAFTEFFALTERTDDTWELWLPPVMAARALSTTGAPDTHFILGGMNHRFQWAMKGKDSLFAFWGDNKKGDLSITKCLSP